MLKIKKFFKDFLELSNNIYYPIVFTINNLDNSLNSDLSNTSDFKSNIINNLSLRNDIKDLEVILEDNKLIINFELKIDNYFYFSEMMPGYIYADCYYFLENNLKIKSNIIKKELKEILLSDKQKELIIQDNLEELTH